MAKLARLMPGLPQYVDPLRLAETEESIAGRLAVSAMPRLREALNDDSGEVEFRLQFGRDGQGLVRIVGDYSTSLRTICQRCLEPLELTLAGAIGVAVAADPETRVTPADAEALPLDEGRLHLPGLVEDEVLLALPIAPMHPAGACRQGVEAGTAREQRATPFAALKGMNIRKK